MTDAPNSDILDRTKVGIFKTDKPLIVYKKIRCQYKPRFGSERKEWRQCIATLEVPKDATVVRPYESWEKSDGPEVIGGKASSKLRTDTYTVKDISLVYNSRMSLFHPLKYKRENCVAVWQPKFEYVNKKTYSEPKLDKNLKETCCYPGLHFFLTKKEAEDYNVW